MINCGLVPPSSCQASPGQTQYIQAPSTDSGNVLIRDRYHASLYVLVALIFPTIQCICKLTAQNNCLWGHERHLTKILCQIVANLHQKQLIETGNKADAGIHQRQSLERFSGKRNVPQMRSPASVEIVLQDSKKGRLFAWLQGFIRSVVGI